MNGFATKQTAELHLECTSPLSEMYTLSPFAWQDHAGYSLLLRAVPHSDNPAEKIAEIYYGRSDDGLHFKMNDHPVIAPGPDEADRDGCEDPTLVFDQDTCFVYYTGWNETKKEGQLLLATGREPWNLNKQGVALPSSNGHANPKEATVISVGDGTWRLFFEYAEAGASKIGMATSPKADGPWTITAPLVIARPDKWDAWHLSTGPILSANPECPVMFYNGATQDAHWRIGWIAFNSGYTEIVARCGEPLIVPQPSSPGDTDIAFASSCVEVADEIFLYYSTADKDMRRATIHRL